MIIKNFIKINDILIVNHDAKPKDINWLEFTNSLKYNSLMNQDEIDELYNNYIGAPN